MNTAQNKTSLKKFVSLVGLASASAFLSFPAHAETSTGCGGYQGNGTTGGGYYCALDRINRTFPDSDASKVDRQSTTGTSYPGNGGASNSGANMSDSPSTTSGSSSTMQQPSSTTQSSTTEQRSTTTTTTSYPANRVTPDSGANTTEQPQPSTPTTNPTTVNQSTDQGVRALW